MEFHPQYKNFRNDNEIDYGPLLRFNFNVLLLVHKIERNEKSKYKVEWYNYLLKSLQDKKVLHPPKFLRGYGTIHRTLVIMRTQDDLRFVKDLGVTSPEFVKKGHDCDKRDQQKSNSQLYNTFKRFALIRNNEFDDKALKRDLEEFWRTTGFEPPLKLSLIQKSYYYFFNKL